MLRIHLLILWLLSVCALAFSADVASVRNEHNLEKRSALALDEADAELDAARKAYTDGDMNQFTQHAQTVGELAELSYQSLDETGKRARRSPKWFKRAEQRMMTLLRRIDSLDRDVSVEDRSVVDRVRTRVSAIHDKLLHDIMSKK